MSDKLDLDAIERRSEEDFYASHEDIRLLVAEVRRLRADQPDATGWTPDDYADHAEGAEPKPDYCKF